MWLTGVPGPVGLWESYIYPTGSVSSRAGIVQLTSLETSIRSMISRAGTVCGFHTGFRIPTISVMWGCKGLIEDRECIYWLYIQAKPEYCHLTCTGHVQVRQDCLRAFYGHKLVGSPCLNVMHAQLPAMAILHPYGPKIFKHSAVPCTGPGEALECTYWLYKPGQTWVCAIYPVQAMHGPRKTA